MSPGHPKAIPTSSNDCTTRALAARDLPYSTLRYGFSVPGGELFVRLLAQRLWETIINVCQIRAHAHFPRTAARKRRNQDEIARKAILVAVLEQNKCPTTRWTRMSGWTLEFRFLMSQKL